MPKLKEKTIRQRVEEFASNWNIADDIKLKFISDTMELIERAKSPEMFCSKCDTRMSINLENGILECFNCGNKKRINICNTSPATVRVPQLIPKNTAPPNQKLLNAIDNAEKGDISKKKGKSIADLANSRGASKVTKEDDDYLKKTIPGASNNKINWV